MAKATTDCVKTMRSITLTVKLKRLNELRLRVWLGRQMLKLAALVMNCNIEMEPNNEPYQTA